METKAVSHFQMFVHCQNTALLSAKVVSAERDERGRERKDATTWPVVVLADPPVDLEKYGNTDITFMLNRDFTGVRKFT